jgi:hypothetical protein
VWIQGIISRKSHENGVFSRVALVEHRKYAGHGIAGVLDKGDAEKFFFGPGGS